MFLHVQFHPNVLGSFLCHQHTAWHWIWVPVGMLTRLPRESFVDKRLGCFQHFINSQWKWEAFWPSLSKQTLPPIPTHHGFLWTQLVPSIGLFLSCLLAFECSLMATRLLLPSSSSSSPSSSFFRKGVYFSAFHFHVFQKLYINMEN